MRTACLALALVLLLVVCGWPATRGWPEAYASPADPAWPVLVISLARRPQRRERLRSQAGRVTFIDAVDGKALAPMPGLTPGELGCFLSHVAIWRRVADGPHDVVMVLEDDANVHLPAQWPDIVAAAGAAPRGWDILFLGHNNQDGLPGIQEARGDVWGAHALLLTRTGAQRLLSALDARGMAIDNDKALPLDVWVSRVPGVRRYCVLPSMIAPFDVQDSDTAGGTRG